MVAHVPVAANNDPRVQYTPVASVGPFNFNFVIFQASDLAVVKTVAGVDTPLTLLVDYTVSLVADFEGGFVGGQITLMAPLTGTLTIYRDLPLARTDDFPNTGNFNITTLNTTLDKFVAMAQQLRALIGRTLVAPVTTALTSFALPAPVADAILGWKTDLSGIENKILAVGAAVYSSIANTQIGLAINEAVTPDALASLWQQGTDIASAATLVKPADANLGGYYNLTGAIAVSAGWAGEKAGRRVLFRVVTGGFNLVHSANWINKTNANIPTAAGDTFEMVAEAGNVWRMIDYEKQDGTALTVTVVSTVPSNLFLWQNFF